jgi:hypothetical protein
MIPFLVYCRGDLADITIWIFSLLLINYIPITTCSQVKVMKEGPLTSPVAKTTSSVSKQKPAPKPVSKAVDGLEKPSVKPTQAIETGDGIVAQNNSSRNGLFGL